MNALLSLEVRDQSVWVFAPSMFKNVTKQSNLHLIFTKVTEESICWCGTATSKQEKPKVPRIDFSINRTQRDWSNKQEQRKFLEEVAQKLKIKDWREWKIKVTKLDIQRLGGRALLDNYYGGDLLNALTSIFPEHPWNSLYDSSLEIQTPKKFPSTLKEQRIFMEIAGKQFGIEINDLDKWYKVTASDMEENTGKNILEFLERHYTGSLIKALQNLFPEINWKPWKFDISQKLPERELIFWSSLENQRAFFNDFASDLQMGDWTNWYQVSFTQIIEYCSFPTLNIPLPSHNPPKKTLNYSYLLGGGREIMRQYDGSLFKALSTIYPFYPWNPSLFYFQPFIETPNVKNGEESKENSETSVLSIEDRSRLVWMDNAIVRQFLARIENQLGLQDKKDWYLVRTSDISQYGGADLLIAYNGSFVRPLVKIYKDYPWDFSKFAEIRESRAFLLEKAKQLNVNQWEDWYQVTYDDLRKFGATPHLRQYNASPMQLIVNSFPEHPWQIWRFNRVPKHYWDNPGHIRDAIYGLADLLGIHSYSTQAKGQFDGNLDDWYRVTYQQIHAYGCKALVDRFGGIIPLLSFVYPNHNWIAEENRNLHMRISNKSQLVLFKLISDLFFKGNTQESDIHVSYHHPQLLYANSRKPMELDIFIPSLSIAFEYQGRQHYTNDIRHRTESSKEDFHHFIYVSDSNVSTLQERDSEKKLACTTLGITLFGM